MPKPPSPAVYFTELRLRNVRCFGDEEQVLSLTDPDGAPARWTVLLGDNGNGKTTVLECLGIGYETTREGTLYRQGVLGKPETVVGELPPLGLAFSKAFAVLPTMIRLGQEAVDQSHFKIRLKVRDGSSEEAVQAGLDTHGGLFMPYTTLRADAVPAIATYAASRRSDMVDTRTSYPLWQEPQVQVERWLRELDYAAAKAKTHRKRLKARLDLAKKMVIGILPAVSDLKFTEPTVGQPTPEVVFETPDGWVPLARTAYGYQTLFVWVLDLVARLFEHYPDSDDPLSEPAVVLVDEIELHLHPSWQRSVLKFLDAKFPRVQWVVTTHSPLVAQAAPEVGANLAVLRRKNDDGTGPVVIDNTPDAVRGWRVDQVLASDLFDTPARDEPAQALLDERRGLLAKPELTAADKKRLRALEERLPTVPLGESRQEVRDVELLRKTLAILGDRLPPDRRDAIRAATG